MRPSSAVALAAVSLLLLSGAAQAKGAAKPSVLVFPIRSHWLSAPLAEGVTGVLVARLEATGFAASQARVDGATVRLAVSEGWLEAEDVEGERVESARQALAVAAGMEGTVVGELVEGESEVTLRAALAGTVSRAEVSFEVSAQATSDWGRLAEELGEKAARRIEQSWAAVDLDEQEAQEAAAAHYASGLAALSQGMYRKAMVAFEAALMGEPDAPDYLWGAAQARVGSGDLDGAMVRLRRLARVAPGLLDVKLLLGDVALLAGQPAQAEAAFRAADALDPGDPRVIEGLARVARDQRQFERAEQYYRLLVAALPGMEDAPVWLPGALAGRKDDEVRLAALPPEEVRRKVAVLALGEGSVDDGVDLLLSYHSRSEAPAYRDEEYLEMLPALDGEAEDIGRSAYRVSAEQALGQIGDEQADAEMDHLHRRSDRLATLAEKMEVSPRLSPAHRYRVLAYNLLNQANFEGLMYLRTRDSERKRRAELLRTASRKARAQAERLGEALLGRVTTGAEESGGEQ